MLSNDLHSGKGRQQSPPGGEDHFLLYQVIYRGKAANLSASFPFPDLLGSHCQRSRGLTEPTGRFYLFPDNGGLPGSQRSWAAALRRPLCSDLGIKHLPVRKNGINTDELTTHSAASVGHGLCGCGLAQYIQQLCLGKLLHATIAQIKGNVQAESLYMYIIFNLSKVFYQFYLFCC